MRYKPSLRGEAEAIQNVALGWIAASAFGLLAMMIPALPLLAGTTDDLAQARKDIEQSKAKRAELESQAKDVESELQDIRERLVTLAQSIRQGENDLNAIGDRLDVLNEKTKAKESVLAEKRGKLAALMQAALALSRTPPEAIVMMPGDPLESMKAAHALKMISESIRSQAVSIGLQMAELQKLTAKVTDTKNELDHRQAKLDEEKSELEQRMAARQTLQRKINRQQREVEEHLQELAKRADDLQGLVSSLTEEARNAPQVEPDSRPPEGTLGNLRSFASAKGRIRSPVAGGMVGIFGASEGNGGTSKGISIAARNDAMVISPFDGEVVFTGPFLDYGKLVILRHSDGFHTLLAGLRRIDVSVGQFLLEGEPIGAMGDGGPDNRLYVELRKNNQPVDPAPWISGLNRKKQGD